MDGSGGEKLKFLFFLFSVEFYLYFILLYSFISKLLYVYGKHRVRFDLTKMIPKHCWSLHYYQVSKARQAKPIVYANANKLNSKFDMISSKLRRKTHEM